MSPLRNRPRAHSTQVDAWLAAHAKGLTAAQSLALISAGLDAIWGHTRTILGEVTLAAIGDRVVHETTMRFPSLGPVTISAAGIDCTGLRARIATVPASVILEGGRCLLVELLTVLDTLTAGILTASLHAKLAAAVIPTAARPHAMYLVASR